MEEKGTSCGKAGAGRQVFNVTSRAPKQHEPGKGVQMYVLTTAAKVMHGFLNNILPTKNKISPSPQILEVHRCGHFT